MRLQLGQFPCQLVDLRPALHPLLLLLAEYSLQLLIFRLQFGVRLQFSCFHQLLLVILLRLLLGFFGIRILASIFFILGGLYEGYLELENVCISRELELHLLRRAVHKDCHV